jgi:shikimate dehydrogenase
VPVTAWRDLAIVNRSITTTACQRAGARRQTVGFEDLASLANEADIIVNSASLGHAGEALPALPAGRGRPFLDMSYGAAARGILAAAQGAGWTPHDGLTMLVGQAAAAFRIWFGGSPDVDGALADCRAAVERR